eukprot:1352385-Pleurochrysis_carterae.AAC.1
MITSRMAKKGRGVRGLVKKSAKLAVLSGAGHERDRDVMRLDAFPHKKMAAVDMFRPLRVVFRVVCQVDRGLVIHMQRRWLFGR